MQAEVGDLLIVASSHVAEPTKTGVIVEVHGEHGGPPYVVRWNGDEHTSTVIPGTDAHVQHIDRDTETGSVSG